MNNKTLAIIALVFAVFVPLVGFILGIVALVKISGSADKSGKGFAIAAVVIGLLVPLLLFSVQSQSQHCKIP